MAFVIAAPSSGCGKTILSLVLLAWARHHGFRVQPFKVGPDYLDPQHLSLVAGNPCRNLDIHLCGLDWVKQSYEGYGGEAEFVLVEGVMGLFDGVGTSEIGSTASIAKFLDLPVVLVIDSSGQAASIAALVRGFCTHDKKLRIAGVVLNKVNSLRHLELLTEVLSGIGVKVLGSLPRDSSLIVPSKNLGLIPADQFDDLNQRSEYYVSLAEQYLDLDSFKRIFLAPKASLNPVKVGFQKQIEKFLGRKYPVAIAQDNAFHFRYEETKDCLSLLGIELIPWSPLSDEPIPKDVKGLMIPGGFPEQYASQLSTCTRSLNQLRSCYGRLPIYAECGGMMLLGESIFDEEGNTHIMSGILPFSSRKGFLKVGYRSLSGINNTLLVKEKDTFTGHEFHRWEIIPKPETINQNKDFFLNKKRSFLSPWLVSGYAHEKQLEGWANAKLHASWVHLHWASNVKIVTSWRESLENDSIF